MQKFSNESPVFCCYLNNFSGYFCTAEKQGHYQLILARCGREVHLQLKITRNGCLEFFLFFTGSVFTLVTALVHSTVLQSYLLYSLLFHIDSCIYEKILSPILLHTLKPIKQRQLSPSDIFLFKFIVNLTHRTEMQQSVHGSVG